MWNGSLSSQMDLPSPSHFGWTWRDESWQPLWTTLPEVSKVCSALLKVGCKKGCSKRCKCVKRQIYRAQSFAHAPQTSQMYQTTQTNDSIFVTRHPISLGLLLRARKSRNSNGDSPLLCLRHVEIKIKQCKPLKSENSILIYSRFS